VVLRENRGEVRPAQIRRRWWEVVSEHAPENRVQNFEGKPALRREQLVLQTLSGSHFITPSPMRSWNESANPAGYRVSCSKLPATAKSVGATTADGNWSQPNPEDAASANAHEIHPCGSEGSR